MRLLATFWIALKHVWYNRRLEAGLLAGLTFAVAVASAIPIYTSASLQRALIREWTESSTSRPPFAVMMSFWGTSAGLIGAEAGSESPYERVHAMLDGQVPAGINIPYSTYARAGALGVKRFVPADPGRRPAQSPFADVWFISNLQDVAEIIEGRWPESKAYADPTHFEVVVDEAALEHLNLLVGTDYIYTAGVGTNQIELTLHVVGAFRPIAESLDTSQWVLVPPFQNVFFVTEQDFKERAMDALGLHPASLDWYWVFDYQEVHIHDLGRFIQTLTTLETRAGQLLPGTRLWTSPLTIFRFYQARANTVSLFLIALSLPIFAMVLYYVSLIAGLAIANRSTEIAMLRSRGAAGYQVLFGFVLEWSILGVGALLLGVPAGMGIARIMGASAGFLSFVDRVALPIALSPEAYRYGLIAVGTALLAALLPAIPAMRHSVVTLKSERGHHRTRSAFWHRYFLDVLVLIGAYVAYRQLDRGTASLEGVPFDPSLFLVPFLFVLGAGLLALRLFPLVMRLLSWVTGRWSGVSWSLTVRQMARGSGQYAPLLLLLIVTTGLGIYAASAARTMDQNLIDRIGYSYGADAVLQEQWVRTVYVPADPNNPDSELVPVEEVFEPPFYVHHELPGVRAAARVMSRRVDVQLGGVHRGQANILGIVPHEFAAVAWFRDSLLPAHRNHYLNALIMHREGVLASGSFMQANGLELGDWVTFNIGGQPVEAYIVAAIDYWPTLDPRRGSLFVLNLEHIQEQTMMEPYDVWLALEPGAQMQQIVNALADEGIYVVQIDDARRELIEARRDPLRMGFFGILTIGFIVAGVATVTGFFLFHFLSMRNRTLQFGVLRAMGLSLPQLLFALVLEGGLTVGAGLGLGSLLGIGSAHFFLPFLQINPEMADSVPPFTVVIDTADILRIYVVLGVMLFLGVLALGAALFRVQLHQAVKLGEEA